MPNWRWNPWTAVVNWKLYVVGWVTVPGSAQLWNEVDEYDPVSNSWTVKTSISTSKHWLRCASLNSKLYCGWWFIPWDHLTTFEEFDPITNTWTTKKPMLSWKYQGGMIEMNWSIYVVWWGNLTNSASIKDMEKYDIASNSWTSLTPMNIARADVFPVSLNNIIYVYWWIEFNWMTYFKSMEIYNQ